MVHPDILEMEQTGYVGEEGKVIGEDDLGRKVYEGDDVYVIDGLKFVVDDLSSDAMNILEMLHAGMETV